MVHGHSVITEAMNMAMFMGCNPIYLIGADFHYEPGTRGSKTFAYDKVKRAYTIIKAYSDKHGIIVQNAGVDSKLDVFDMIDYNSLFK
jgi:hypothetical protein